MPGFHVFYCHHRTGEVIASHAPTPVKTERIAALAGDVLEQNGDFLGLVDDDECVLQFMYLPRLVGDDHSIRMEMTDSAGGENVIKHISDSELFDLLQNLPEKLTIDVITKVGVPLETS